MVLFSAVLCYHIISGPSRLSSQKSFRFKNIIHIHLKKKKRTTKITKKVKHDASAIKSHGKICLSIMVTFFKVWISLKIQLGYLVSKKFIAELCIQTHHLLIVCYRTKPTQ